MCERRAHSQICHRSWRAGIIQFAIRKHQPGPAGGQGSNGCHLLYTQSGDEGAVQSNASRATRKFQSPHRWHCCPPRGRLHMCDGVWRCRVPSSVCIVYTISEESYYGQVGDSQVIKYPARARQPQATGASVKKH